ncbi:MAG: (Fe-S)-binding protein [Myxococcota bacterium]
MSAPPPAAGLLDYAGTLDCIHCGLCLPHCPTYQETGRETSSPRGRIHLLRAAAEGRIPLAGAVAEEAFFCLACRACESACPAGVRFGRLVESARAEIVARGLRARWKRTLRRLLLRHVVASPRALRLLAGSLRLYQRRGPQRWVRRSGVLRLAPALHRAERQLPPLPDSFRPPILVPAEGRRRGRVALFTGCVMRELFEPVHRATVQVLARNGFEVLIPSGQRCCGALHLHDGDRAGAEALLEQNRASLRLGGVDALIVNSAGCGAVLKEAGDPIGRKTRDISEFLCSAGLRPPSHSVELRVAYDDPCHLLHAQRIERAPRELLSAVPGLELFDLPGARDCCGAAGLYSLTHPEMSERLLARKIDALERSRPHAVATGNPGCLLQFSRGVHEAGLSIRVLHPVELLALAYGQR